MLNITHIHSDCPVAKTYALLATGAIKKTSLAKITSGHAERVSFANITDYGAWLGSVGVHDAVTYGTPEVDAPITTAARRKEGEIARTREFFKFRPCGGIIFIDVDNATRTAEAIYQSLISASPWLINAKMLWRASSSSGINGGAIKGHHFYCAVDDASQIPRLGKRLECDLWAAGHGFVEVGAAGQMLVRCLVDTSVWQPERLDFVAPPLLCGVSREVPPACYFGGEDILKSDDVEEGCWEALRQRVAMAKAAKLPEAEPVQRSYAAGVAKRLGVTQAAVMMLHKGVMPKDFVLTRQGGQQVTCEAILADPEAWQGKRFCDPLEPEYGGDDRIAVCCVSPSGAVTLYSHAHGGQTWLLKHSSGAVLDATAPDSPQVSSSGKVSLLVLGESELYRDVLRVLDGVDVFNGAAGLTRVSEGKLVTLTAEDTRRVLCDEIEFFSYEKDKKTGDEASLVACPRNLHTMLHGLTAPPELRVLRGVAHMPLVLGKEIISKRGYNAASKLWLDLPDADYADLPSAVEGLDDFSGLLDEFRFADNVDWVATIGLMMTACLRKSLPTTPGWLIDAPRPQSGKTYLAELVGALACGYVPSVMSMPSEEVECGKKLTAVLLAGESAVIFDDLKRDLPPHPALCSLFTSETLSDRLLGHSRSITVSTQTTVIFTGNNIAPGLDLARRIIPIRLDPKTPSPQNIHYAHAPIAKMLSDRAHYIRATLGIVSGYWQRQDERGGLAHEGSYGAWQELVRKPLWWLTGGDVLERLNHNRMNSGVPEELLALLVAISASFGATTWTAAELVKNLYLTEVIGNCVGGNRVNALATANYIKRYVDFETSAGTLRLSSALGGKRSYRIA